MEEDTEEKYREYLAYLISKTKSRGHSRYYNKFLNKCRDEAAARYPKGAGVALKKSRKAGGFLGILQMLFG